MFVYHFLYVYVLWPWKEVITTTLLCGGWAHRRPAITTGTEREAAATAAAATVIRGERFTCRFHLSFGFFDHELFVKLLLTESSFLSLSFSHCGFPGSFHFLFIFLFSRSGVVFIITSWTFFHLLFLFTISLNTIRFIKMYFKSKYSQKSFASIYHFLPFLCQVSARLSRRVLRSAHSVFLFILVIDRSSQST